MVEIEPGLQIDERELDFRFVRAAGPGGQNVNKVATAVQLRFDLQRSALPAPIKSRLIRIAGRQISSRGILVIEARRFRTQAANRSDAIRRLAALLRRASKQPKTRTATEPSRAARARRLQSKKRRSRIKKQRGGSLPSDELRG